MQTTLDRTVQRMTAANSRLKDERANSITMDVGFPFSAWIFLTTVALTFLDAYLLGGKGSGTYLDVPVDVFANVRNLMNV